MALLPVEDALARILADADPRPPETVPLAEAGGRILAEAVTAARDQPPFDASAMDGYAVRAADIAAPPARLRVVGEAAAGRRFEGEVGPGEAVRIFTGAPVPPGADTILIQENARRLDEATIEALDATGAGRHIRRAGLDFATGRIVLEAGRELDAAALSLAASANRPALSVHGMPVVAILATGDELVPPGTPPGPDQIVSSNNVGVSEIVRRAGGRSIDLGIAPELANVVSSAEAARRLIDEMGSVRLRIVLDAANLFETATPDAQRAIVSRAGELLADRIAMAHAKDRDAAGRFVAAGEGVLDYPHYLGALRGAGFDGPLVTHGLGAAEAPAVAAFLGRELETLT